MTQPSSNPLTPLTATLQALAGDAPLSAQQDRIAREIILPAIEEWSARRPLEPVSPEDLAAYLDGNLKDLARERVQAQLSRDPALVLQLVLAAPLVEPEESEDGARVYSFPARSGGPATPPPIGDREPRSMWGSFGDRGSSRRRPGRRLRFVAAAAGLLLGVSAMWAALGPGGDPTQTLGQPGDAFVELRIPTSDVRGGPALRRELIAPAGWSIGIWRQPLDGMVEQLPTRRVDGPTMIVDDPDGAGLYTYLLVVSPAAEQPLMAEAEVVLSDGQPGRLGLVEGRAWILQASAGARD